MSVVPVSVGVGMRRGPAQGSPIKKGPRGMAARGPGKTRLCAVREKAAGVREL